MPLVNEIQDFNIVLRNEDFSEPVALNAPAGYGVNLRIGKWIEISPTLLLPETRKLFIDASNYIYNISSINQAIRLFIRPLAIGASYSKSTHVFMGYDLGSQELSDMFFCNRAKLIYYSGDINNRIAMSIAPYESLQPNLKNQLGSVLPTESITTTFYLDGKFLANQPHIEHLNSGDYSIYNNLRCVALAGDTTLNDLNWDSISNGFIFNSYYNNPTCVKVTNEPDIWSFKYANFNLKIKYISNIIDLATSYLSYSPTYLRYVVVAKSGNLGIIWNEKEYFIDSRGYSIFEFFYAPVGEAS